MAEINYSEYTWRDCKFDPTKHPELRTTSKDTFWKHVGKILGSTISLAGDYDIVVTSGIGEPYISAIKLKSSDLRITCIPNNMSVNDKDNWYLKVQSNGVEIAHQSTDDALTVTCKANGPQTITELNLGERTAHKVYNSYQWLNQTTSQYESYWPYGCVLMTHVPATDNQIRIDYDTFEPMLKRYSIPKFYVDNRSVSGYGWARPATIDEELSSEEGYQSKYILSPFMTTKPKQMLYLLHQLRDPGFTILYNGWEWNKTHYTPITNVVIQDEIVYLYNNKRVISQYAIQPGDVLIKCTVNQNFLSQVYRNLSLRDIYNSSKILSIDYGSLGSSNLHGTITSYTTKTSLVTDSTLWDTTAYNRWTLGSDRFASDFQDGYNVLYTATASHTIEVIRQKDVQWTSADITDFTNDVLISTIDVDSQIELTAPVEDHKQYDLGANIDIGADLYPLTVKGKLRIQNVPILKFQRNTEWQLVNPGREGSLDWFYNFHYYQSSTIQPPCFQLTEGNTTISTFTPLLGIVSEPIFYTSYLFKPFYFPLLGTTPPGAVYTDGVAGSSYVWPRLFAYTGWMPNDASVVCLDGLTTRNDNIIDAWANLKQYDHQDVDCSNIPFFEIDNNHYLPPQDSGSDLYQQFDCYIVWHFVTLPDQTTEDTDNGSPPVYPTPH